jgi:hypothetical protein
MLERLTRPHGQCARVPSHGGLARVQQAMAPARPRRSHGGLVPTFSSQPHQLPGLVKRGMALVCHLLHGASSTVGSSGDGGAYDPLLTQYAHNMNGHAFIKVIGVGGGGGNAVARMINSGLQVRLQGGVMGR